MYLQSGCVGGRVCVYMAAKLYIYTQVYHCYIRLVRGEIDGKKTNKFKRINRFISQCDRRWCVD